ncbi:hypothetical protein P879_05738 [Paragonimus westermani]|uniref:Uncharacterized protein n=1 Tax=Paragonimus westermani TaxID=34504 RepID=A0A8T0CZ42_9TREM|nr:hypothetical protein P879_05738 [Paragonimus westermani]
MPSRQNSDQFVRTETGSVLHVIDGISTKQVVDQPVLKACFQVTRAQIPESQTTTSKPISKRSSSTPQELNELQVQTCPQHWDSTHISNKAPKKKLNTFRKLFRRGDRSHSQGSFQGNIDNNEFTQLEENQRRTELQFAHTLMGAPEELNIDLCRIDSEPDLVQTVCEPRCFTKEVIRLDKKLYQIDVANARIATLNSLSGTAAMAKDLQTLKFLHNRLISIRKQRSALFKEADKYLTKFKHDPNLLLVESSRTRLENILQMNSVDSAGSYDTPVTFVIQDDEDDAAEDVRWEMNSLSFSTENTSDESDPEGPTTEELEHLAREIRRSEGTRFKRKHKARKLSRKNSNACTPEVHKPPPPNPLGHSKRAMFRSHTTVPSGLCQQQHMQSSAVSLTSLPDGSRDERSQFSRSQNSSKLPFNLLSLTGQLSWLVSEYIPRDCSTYKWAMDLINRISRMSVTRSAWLNVHQQLRETTELLYSHRDRNQHATNSITVKGEVAWSTIQCIHQTIVAGDNNTTITLASGGTRRLLASDTHSEPNRTLHHLSTLLERKFHLAYVCDLLLWRAHIILFSWQTSAPNDTAKHQLIDFRIRHMQLRLDQANVQNWSPELIDWMMCWIVEAIELQRSDRSLEDLFCLDELQAFRISVGRFRELVEHLRASEFLSEEYLSVDKKASDASETCSQNSDCSRPHHLHYHPHHYHHGRGGQQQDLRPLDADRCSHTYSALIRQIHDHAMSKRPLTYFAKRALYDVAMELDCQIDWEERLTTLLDELSEAYIEWEQLLTAKLSPEYAHALFQTNSLLAYTENKKQAY